jgi:uncharacterized protein YbjT (DUF2867 family)
VFFSRLLENFSEQVNHFKSITEENRILSATGPGRIPWVATEDIAAMGYYALTTCPAPNTDYLVLGPDLLTYNEVRSITYLPPLPSLLLGRNTIARPNHRYPSPRTC